MGASGDTRLVLADRNEAYRESMALYLDALSGIAVVGETRSGDEALELLDRHRTNLLITDLELEGLPGLEVLRTVQDRVELASLVVTRLVHPSWVRAAFRNGASGFVSKDEDLEVMEHAITEVVDGRPFIGSSIVGIDVETVLRQARREGPLHRMHGVLTDREREVLTWVARGLSSSEIAAKLFISRRTVDVHRSSLLEKLGAHNSADLVRLAYDHNILPLREDSLDTADDRSV